MKTFINSKPVQIIITCLVAAAAALLGPIIVSPIYLVANWFGDTAVFMASYFMFLGIWIFMLLLWLIVKKYRPMFRIFGSEAKGNRIGVSLPLGLIFGLGLNLLVGLIAILHGDIKLSFFGFNPVVIILFIIVIAIQSGAEELICRGYMYQNLRRIFRDRPWIAIVGNALIFSLGHVFNPGISPMALLNILLAGILFSLIIYYFDSFWACVIAHTGWNFCQNIILGLPNSGTVSQYSIFKLDAASGTASFAYDPVFGLEGTVTSVVVLTAACAAVILIGRKRAAQPLDIWEEKVSS